MNGGIYMTNLFGERNPREINRYTFRENKETIDQARSKATSDGTTLSYLLKCVIAGYLAGDILAEQILALRKDK